MVDQIKNFFCFKHRFVIANLVTRNIKLRYRRSVLGLFWTILSPASLAVVYYIVFKYFVKIQVENYLTMLLVGVLSWSFFSNAVTGGLESIAGNQPIFNKVPLNLNVFNFSEAITGFINLIFAFPVIVLISMVTGHGFSWTAILAPGILLLLFTQAFCFGLMLGMFFVYLRDLRHVIGILIQILFYLSPIIYRADAIPANFWYIKYLNPVFCIFSSLQSSLVFNLWVDPVDLVVSFFWTFIVFIFTFSINIKLKDKIVEDL